MYKKPGPSRYTKKYRKEYPIKRRENIRNYLRNQYTVYEVHKPKTRKRWSSLVASPFNQHLVNFTHWIHKKVRKAGLRAFKQGTHPQQWRVKGLVGPRKKIVGKYALLGPAGALGEDLIIMVVQKTTAVRSNLFILASQLYPRHRTIALQILDELKSYLTYFLVRPLVRYILNQIDRIVPVDSGDLRASLRNTLKYGGTVIREAFSQTSSTKAVFRGVPVNAPPSRLPLRIIIGTPFIEYAKPVNNMPDEALQHPGNHKRVIGSHTGYYLNDPYAKSHFYDKILRNGRYRARKYYENFLEEASNFLFMKYFRAFNVTTKATIKREIKNNIFTVLYK